MSIEEDWIKEPCSFCGAAPNQPCMGPGGRRARETHSARVLLAKAKKGNR